MKAISMKICKSLTLFLIFSILLDHGVEGRVMSPRDFEIKRYLKKMNKPALKTIKSPTGELIDCIDFYKQPSLDHPLLRNHTIQMAPSFNPNNKQKEEIINEIQQLWHVNGKCPEGTVPIQRIQKSDILRFSSSVGSFGKKYPPKFIPRMQTDQPVSREGHEYSVVIQKGGPYFGATADINLWNPRVEPNDFSLAQIWIVSDGGSPNTVEAGLTVNPILYGSNDTRLFVFWTADAYKSTGCYNLLCQGFVQTSNKMAINTGFSPVSAYGQNQYQINIKIFKDAKLGGNWWLTVNGNPLGYWPNELLKDLQGGAKVVEWGGEVWNSNFKKGSTTTQMGSGHFSGEGFKKAAFFRSVQTFDVNKNPHDPIGPLKFVKNPNCYDLQYDGSSIFFYGGPGKNPKCP